MKYFRLTLIKPNCKKIANFKTALFPFAFLRLWILLTIFRDQCQMKTKQKDLRDWETWLKSIPVHY